MERVFTAKKELNLLVQLRFFTSDRGMTQVVSDWSLTAKAYFRFIFVRFLAE